MFSTKQNGVRVRVCGSRLLSDGGERKSTRGPSLPAELSLPPTRPAPGFTKLPRGGRATDVWQQKERF